MTYLFYIILLGLFWWITYLLIRGKTGILSGKTAHYSSWMSSTLDSMFYSVNPERCLGIVLVLMLFMGAAGFAFPGKMTEINLRMSVEKAVDFNRQGDYQAALYELYDLKEHPAPILHNELGVAYTGLGNLGIAEKEFITAVTLLPDYSRAHYNLYQLYLNLNRPMEAGFELSRAKETKTFEFSEKKLYGTRDNQWKHLIKRLGCAFIFALIGGILPWGGISWLKTRRTNKYGEQLADALGMLANALRAGLSLQQAMENVVNEAKPPVSQEFGLVLKEIRLGADLEVTLKNLSDRMPTNDTKIFVNSIMILHESGGNLTEIFDTISHSMRERRRVHSKIKTMTAEGETQALILATLPIVMGLMLNQLDPESFSLMYTTFWGWVMLILSFLMEVVGIFWMLKIVKVKI